MLLDLPPEILTHILLSLPFTLVVICQGVNHHLLALISESIALQYYIHLGMSGLADNSCCNLPVSERLSRLLAKERRWEELDFDFDKIVKVPFGLNIHAKLSTGLFYGVSTNERFCSMRIPSVPDREVKWQEVYSERRIISSGVCVYEHDLQVLVTAQPRTLCTNAAEFPTIHEIQVHLNQLSTGEPHPDAQQATISFETHEEFENPYTEIVCTGDNLIFVLMDPDSRNKPGDQVYVYEWRTGQLKLRHSAPFHSYHYPLVLTADILLLSNQNTGELEYWRIPKNPSEPTPNQPFFILASPQLRSGNTFTYLRCRAEPNPGIRPCDVSKPFYTAPQHAIVVFCIGVQSTGFVGFMFFVHRSSLVGFLDKFSSSTSFTNRPRPVPYDEWGPPACRWINGERSWIEITFGQRFIVPPPERATGRKPLTLIDFNPIDVAKVLAAEKHRLQMGPEFHAMVVQAMDPLNDPDGCFENAVYSSLPYTIRISQEKYSFSALILDEESILGIKVRNYFPVHHRTVTFCQQEDEEERVKELHILHYG
ncbi:hypothetical protein P691DRAFT_680660 [Macrolepiota fuliginosa MF-IS2]|uniref:F-box domain-containing protein n=1 Tax=Macrolepiota fuliginosa MF-IS2 TaxID=1400762 RepID=A0A9P5X3B9_9AGAR|nr:hypothetical protein P691DRAFT_680660 [Macrolepiota fuliginosa MF-IS2]